MTRKELMAAYAHIHEACLATCEGRDSQIWDKLNELRGELREKLTAEEIREAHSHYAHDSWWL